MVKILTRRKQLNGYAAKVNVVNYSGQTPLYSAARSGNLEVVRLLVEAGAHVDLNSGELVKQSEQEDDSYESQFERYFMEAFMNTMTPLQIATVLGFDEIALYLIDRGADPNLRSNVKGYTPLHMAVLANKPEMLIELLTKTNASATIEDSSGRTLIDMVN
jgi:ankyrin repeat protein